MNGPAAITSAKVKVLTGAFGKHPVWLDFPDALGDQSSFISRAKEELLFEGILVLAEKGIWAPEVVVEGDAGPTGWEFIWQLGRECLAGILWPSRDKEGRSCPMVLCSHLTDVGLDRVESIALPSLWKATVAIRSATSPKSVAALVREANESVVRALADAGNSGPAVGGGGAGLIAELAAEQGGLACQALFHAVRLAYEGVGLGTARRAAKSDGPFRSLRVPVPEGKKRSPLGGWVDFLRSQVSDRVAVLAIRPEGRNWVDLMVGDLAAEPLATLQKPPSLVPPATEGRHALPAGFGDLVSAAFAALTVPWGTAGKVSIFGPIPKGYQPTLPGAVTPRGWHGGLSRLSALRDNSPEGFRRAMLAAALAGLFALVTAGWLLWPSSSGKVPKPGKPGSTSVVNPPLDPIAVTSPSVQDEALRVEWFTYINDHDRWLWWVGDGEALSKAVSPGPLLFLRNAFVSNRVTQLDPGALLGDRDPVNRQAPSASDLRSRAAEIRRAAAVRDQARTLLETVWPVAVEQQIKLLAPSDLTALVEPSLTELRAIQRVLADCLVSSTNIPDKTPAARVPVAQAVGRLAALEASFVGVSLQYSNWSKLRDSLVGLGSESLAGLLKAQAIDLASATNRTLVATNLARLVFENRDLSLWAEANWTNVDRTALEIAVQAVRGVASVSEWKRFAFDHARLLAPEEDGSAFGRMLADDATAGMVRELAEADRRLTLVPPQTKAVVASWTNFVGKLKVGAAIPALQKNRSLITNQVAILREEHARIRAAVAEAWAAAFDIRALLAANRQVDFGDENFDRIWSEFVDKVGAASAGAKTPDALMLWHGRLDRMRQFLADLKKINPDLPKNVVESAAVTSRGSQTNQMFSLLKRDYVTALVWSSVDRRSLEVTNRSGAGPLNAKTRGDLDEEAARWWGAVTEMLSVTTRLERGDFLQGNFGQIKSAATILTGPSSFPSAVKELPEVAAAAALASEYVLAPLPDNLGSRAKPVTNHNRAGVLLWAARLDALPGWPSTPSDWEKLGAVGVLLKRLDPDSKMPNWRSWIAGKWRATSTQSLTFENSGRWLAALEGTGLERQDLPAGLYYNGSLAGLKVSLSSAGASDYPVLRAKVEAFQKLQPAQGVNSALLSEIASALSNDGVLSGTAWGSLDPNRAGFQVEAGGMNRAVVRLGQLRLPFLLVDVPGQRPIFLAEMEFSCKDLATLASVRGRQLLNTNLQNQIGNFVRNHARELAAVWKPENLIQRRMMHPAFSLFNWRLEKKADVQSVSLRENRDLDGSKALSAGIDQSVSGSAPANFISARWAEDIVNAMGCRLPSTSEWTFVQQGVNNVTRANVGNGAILQTWFDLIRPELSGVSAEDFIGRMIWDPKGRTAIPAGATPGRSKLFFSEAGNPEFRQSGFVHWIGNVAELLEADGRFFVAGGSAVTPADASVNPVEVPADRLADGYADVGIRLAFDWKGELPADRIRRLASRLSPEP